MKYRAIKPPKVGWCEGCIFLSKEDGCCDRPDSIKYQCCADSEHKFIWVISIPILNKQIKVL